ncbi:MAG: IS21 family transposase [Actinomycetota bacterium]|nr:IS21 family transposase [Actinomycetota bacterium]
MRRTDMLKAREILRLKKAGLSLRDIAQSCSCGKTTISEVLARARKAKIKWPLDLSDKKLISLLYPPTQKQTTVPEPDMEYVFYEMKKKGLTLMLLWEEYKERYSNGIMYTQFCSRYRDFKKSNRLTMHIEHKAGEEMQVDWAGQTISYADRITGELKKAYIFVAVLPASSYPFVYAYDDRKLSNWIDAHVRAFEYFGGVPLVTIPDNTKTAVITPDVTEPVLNRSYSDMANHYSTAIVPARSGRPKDKAADENMVGNVLRRILAPIRNVKFFSVYEINQAIAAELSKFVRRPFKKMEGNRLTAFLKIDRPALMPLSGGRYEYCDWKQARIAYNYHVEYKNFYYSTHYSYAGSLCSIRATKDTIEVFVDSQRVAAHKRNYDKGNRYTTLPEHMADEHRAVSGWSTDRFISWANKIGPSTGEFVKKVLLSRKYPVQAYRACMTIMSHTKNSPPNIIENAAKKALDMEIYSYKYFKMIINKESIKKVKDKRPNKAVVHSNLRGKSACVGGGINA